MLKLIGLGVIFISCSMAGNVFYRYTVNCCNYVSGLIDGLKCLRREIEFSQEHFSEALIKSSQYAGDARELFKNCGQDFARASEYISSLCVDQRTKNICCFFFGQMGRNSLENELKLIDVTVEKLNILYNEQKKISENNGKLCAKTGVLAGLLFVILLL